MRVYSVEHGESKGEDLAHSKSQTERRVSPEQLAEVHAKIRALIDRSLRAPLGNFSSASDGLSLKERDIARKGDIEGARISIKWSNLIRNTTMATSTVE